MRSTSAAASVNVMFCLVLYLFGPTAGMAKPIRLTNTPVALRALLIQIPREPRGGAPLEATARPELANYGIPRSFAVVKRDSREPRLLVLPRYRGDPSW